MKARASVGTDAWYAAAGPEDDVVLSTRVRLARNLANYPFPPHFARDDAEHVQALVFDSFAHGEHPESFHALAASDLDELGAKILSERGVIDEGAKEMPGSGIVMRTDGNVACTVNTDDHVRISAFVAGLDGNAAYALCRQLDEDLQKSLQFAASYDFGFLTSSVLDCGSGMKVSARVHLPSVSFAGTLHDLVAELGEKGIEVAACFGAGQGSGTSLGAYYQISARQSAVGSEFDQMAAVVSAVRYVAECERRERKAVVRSRPTEMRDAVCRAFATMRFASLMPLREAVDSIGKLKWGMDAGIAGGVTDSDLCALLYRIQDGHLQFVLKNGSFRFPADIAKDRTLQTERLRAVIMQESFERLTM